jgi:tetratricopeptide (TPR) repeat protein
MGNVQYQEKNYDAAIDLFQQALAIAKACFSNQLAITATIFSNIGQILYEQKRYDEAVEHLQQAERIKQIMLRRSSVMRKRCFCITAITTSLMRPFHDSSCALAI